MTSLFAFFMLFLVVVAATVVARSIAISSAGDGLPLTMGSHVSDVPLTPLSTESAQARTLAAQLGSGWALRSFVGTRGWYSEIVR
jgi:hypothetical protein